MDSKADVVRLGRAQWLRSWGWLEDVEIGKDLATERPQMMRLMGAVI